MAASSIYALCYFIVLFEIRPLVLVNGNLTSTSKELNFHFGCDSTASHHPALSVGPLYYINFRAAFRCVEASSNARRIYPVLKASKHGMVTLALPNRLFWMDLNIYMDVESNPGDDITENPSNRTVLVRNSDLILPPLKELHIQNANCFDFNRNTPSLTTYFIS